MSLHTFQPPYDTALVHALLPHPISLSPLLLQPPLLLRLLLLQRLHPAVPRVAVLVARVPLSPFLRDGRVAAGGGLVGVQHVVAAHEGEDGAYSVETARRCSVSILGIEKKRGMYRRVHAGLM